LRVLPAVRLRVVRPHCLHQMLTIDGESWCRVCMREMNEAYGGAA
jgi:hypothetical protein